MHPTEGWRHIEQRKTWPVSTLLKKLSNDNLPKMKLQQKLPILRYDREWTHSRHKGWPYREGPRNEEPLEVFVPNQDVGPKAESTIKVKPYRKFRTANWKWGSVRNFGMIESLYPTQPRITMETPSRKLQTNRLPRPLSNCQVSMTPESQSKERAEPQSGKQKAQY